MALETVKRFLLQRQQIHAIQDKFSAFLRIGTNSSMRNRVVVYMQRKMKAKVEEKRERMHLLLVYWQNVVSAYEGAMKESKKGLKDKSQTTADYKLIKNVTEQGVVANK